MKKISAVVFWVVLAVGSMSGFAFAQEKKDAKGCKDHPLFTRMPGTYIYQCRELEHGHSKVGCGVGIGG